MTITEPTNSRGNILLVDDIPENLQLLSELLTQLGYNIRSVTNGRMAMKTLNVKRPDLILLDIKMPEMDGYQVCAAIKANESLRDIPVIFISALDDAFDKVKAFACGGVDYITKPFQIEEVVARLENQLTIQRQKFVLLQEVKKRQEAEEVLYQSRALLSSVLNTALDGIAALQTIRNLQTGEIEDFRCLVVNPVIAKVFEKSREELIGKRVFKKFIYRINPEFFDRIISVVETGEPVEADFYYPWGDSSWYHFVAVKLGDGFAITVRDITLRKKMELELQAANRELQLLAHMDGLTKIANRRCFDEFLAREWRRLCRSSQPISLLLLDVDYFKSYNDYFGHQRGDDCLIQIADILQKTVSRPVDIVARYGGEEFVIVLPETSQDGAVVIAQAIHNSIQTLEILHPASTVNHYVTVSIGISCVIPDHNLSLEFLIDQADKALYVAKQKGRNCYDITQF
ncbi:MAG: diguanylate cyclase [Methylococcales bacterium]|nr:diguanylate cyclase [Methylococcales bacterium]